MANRPDYYKLNMQHGKYLVTFPISLVKKLNLNKGDLLKFSENNGVVNIQKK